MELEKEETMKIYVVVRLSFATDWQGESAEAIKAFTDRVEAEHFCKELKDGETKTPHHRRYLCDFNVDEIDLDQT